VKYFSRIKTQLGLQIVWVPTDLRVRGVSVEHVFLHYIYNLFLGPKISPKGYCSELDTMDNLSPETVQGLQKLSDKDKQELNQFITQEGRL
jgi:hypothetical protein